MPTPKTKIGCGLARGRINAKSRAYRSRRRSGSNADRAAFLGMAELREQANCRVEWFYPPEQMPDDDITVLAHFRSQCEPELVYHADGFWWNAETMAATYQDVLAWCALPYPPARVQPAGKPLRKHRLERSVLRVPPSAPSTTGGAQ